MEKCPKYSKEKCNLTKKGICEVFVIFNEPCED
jgi:hypothetical protein